MVACPTAEILCGAFNMLEVIDVRTNTDTPKDSTDDGLMDALK